MVGTGPFPAPPPPPAPGRLRLRPRTTPLFWTCSGGHLRRQASNTRSHQGMKEGRKKRQKYPESGFYNWTGLSVGLLFSPFSPFSFGDLKSARHRAQRQQQEPPRRSVSETLHFPLPPCLPPSLTHTHTHWALRPQLSHPLA